MSQIALLAPPVSVTVTAPADSWNDSAPVSVSLPRVAAFQSVPPISRMEMRPAMPVQNVFSAASLFSGLMGRLSR